MHALDFLKDPSPAATIPIVAVFGDEAYLRRESLAAIGRAALGDNAEEDWGLSRFNGAQAELAPVLDEARTAPFLAKRRVVVVEDADPFVTKYRKELETYAEHPSATGTLVLAVKTWPSNTKLAKLVAKVGLAVECKSPRESEMPPWLVQQAKNRFALKLETDAARLLLELVGPELGVLAAELDKLASYVGDRKTIRREDVSRNVGAGRIETIWQVLDAATTGQAQHALEQLDHLLLSGESPVGLISAMSASLLKVYHAGQRRRLARRDLVDACRDAGIPPFATEKVGKQHAHLGPSRVARLPRRLLKADLDLKGSSTLPPRVILEQLLLELAQPRKD